MRLNLLVIRTEKPETLKSQYEKLGFEFEYHKHGNGPLHFASEINNFVFEIYPLSKTADKVNNSLRLGFEIENLELKIENLKDSNWKILSQPTKTEWGIISIVQDLDGRKIELKNKEHAT